MKMDQAVSEKEALERLEREPKRAIWETTMFVAATLQLQADSDRVKRLINEYKLSIVDKRKKT